MFVKFEKEINILTERSTTMGIEEFLLDRAKKEGRRETAMEKDCEFIKILLLSTDLDGSKIAGLINVSEDLVLKVKKDLGK